MNYDFQVVEKSKEEFQKLLNQWKHKYEITPIFIEYDKEDKVYRAIIIRFELDNKEGVLKK